jgi:hypothetical protein
MRAAAKLLFAFGLALVVIGFAAAGLLFIQRHLAQQPLARLPIETDAVFETGSLSLGAERVRLAVQLTLSSRAVAKEASASGAGAEVDLYRVPVHFQVRDAAGHELFVQLVSADAVRGRILRQGTRQRLIPVLHDVEVVSDPLRPGDNPLQVAVELLPDETFGARIERAVLLVRPVPAPIVPALLEALALVLAGFAMLLLGMVAELASGVLPRSRRGTRLAPRSGGFSPILARA